MSKLFLLVFSSLCLTTNAQNYPSEYAYQGVLGMTTSIPFKTLSSDFNRSYFHLLPSVGVLIGFNYRNKFWGKLNYKIGIRYKDVGYRIHNYAHPSNELFVNCIQKLKISSYEVPFSVEVPLMKENFIFCTGINPHIQVNRIFKYNIKDIHTTKADSIYIAYGGHFYPKKAFTINIFIGVIYKLNPVFEFNLSYYQGFNSVTGMDYFFKTQFNPEIDDLYGYFEPILSNIDFAIVINLNNLKRIGNEKYNPLSNCHFLLNNQPSCTKY